MARAVDDPVYTAVPVEGLSHERFEVPHLSNRASEAETAELPRQILGLPRRRQEGHAVAALRELPGAGGPHAAPGRRHHGYLLPDPLGSVLDHAPTYPPPF